MNNKYLPIGTVCSLKNDSKKVMITGFLSYNYNDNISLFDYEGYIYPMGSLSKDIISFNHDDIDRIEFIGYISGEHQNFNNFLLNFNSNDGNQLNSSTDSVLEVDNKIEIEEPKPIFITPIEYTSNDSNNYDNSVSVNNATNDNSIVDNKNIYNVYEEEINSNINDNIVVFDENGMINSNNLNDSIPSSPVNNDIISNSIGVMSPTIDYKFDENGIVIAEV